MIAQRPHPFDVVARVLCERLRGGMASEPLRAMVASRGIAWQRVVSVASAELVLPAFAAALEDLDLIGALDQELGAFLEAVHAANRERNGELRDELATAARALNRVGIEPVLLKGSLRLLDGLYPDDGWRMLRDLDLLLPEASLATARRALEAAGYAACGSRGEMRRREGACQIDLHTDLLNAARDLRLLPAVDVLNAARRATLGPVRVGIPAVEHQLVHLVGHGQIRHLGHACGRIPMRDRLEAAALVHWGREAIDWQAVGARFSAAGFRRPLVSFLLSLDAGAWCAVPVPERTDRLTVLQQRRIELQDRSATCAYIGSRLGWWVSAFSSQFEVLDGGQRRVVRNARRLICERGAIRQLARAFADRQTHLMHALPVLIWFTAS
jgi:hypothetical protein